MPLQHDYGCYADRFQTRPHTGYGRQISLRFESSSIPVNRKRMEMHDALKPMIVLSEQGLMPLKGLPKEEFDHMQTISDEISLLWGVVEYGNDNCYFSWPRYANTEEWWYDREDDNLTYATRWPAIAAFLLENGVKECLIHYWW